MNTITCEALDKTPNKILIFGLVQPVKEYREIEEANLGAQGFHKQCMAQDQYGNMYDIWTDYDACLRISYTVALIKRRKTV